MRMFRRLLRQVRLMTIFLSVLLAISACEGGTKGSDVGVDKGSDKSSDQSGNTASNASLGTIDKPVTLKVYIPMSDEQYQTFFEKPITQKFPNVTLERLPGNGVPGLQTLLNAGTTPDIVYAVPGWYGKEKLMDVYTDLTPFIKKYNFDLNTLDPVVQETMKTYSPQGTIDFLPESMTTLLLVYNKAIFNKFGLPYPKSGMTWDDVTEVIKKVSRTSDGKTYYGFNMDAFFPINNSQLSLAFVNPSTNKAAVNNEGWQKFFTTFKQLFEAEGNRMNDKQLGNLTMFTQDQTVAMHAMRLEQVSNLALAKDSSLDWDLTTAPTFKDAPNTGTQINAPYLAITPASDHKDEAFKVIAYLLSAQVQLEHNKDGRLTVLKDEAIRNQFGNNIKELAGKNIHAALELKPAKPRTFTIYDDYVVTSLSSGLVSVITGQKDINTALRDAEADANDKIEQNKR